MRRIGSLSLILAAAALLDAAAADAPAPPPVGWPQVRGPGASGVSSERHPLPVEFRAAGAIWRTPLPQGHSSPCIGNERVFLTAFDRDAQRLETMCLARADGRILWRQAAPATSFEKVHPLSTPANATPATDGQRVYVYFGSFGLLCYDFSGAEIWRLPQAAAPTPYGSGSSPIVAGEYVILSVESPPKPVLLAIDRHTGQVVWRYDGLPYLPGYATPVVWNNAGTEEVVLHSSVGVTALRLADGAPQWWLSQLSAASSTPAISDGRLFVAACWPGGEPEDRIPLPEFDQILARCDANRNGHVDRQELPADMLIVRRAESGDIPGAEIRLADVFPFFDADADQRYERGEWDKALAFSRHGREQGLLAVRAGGQGDVTKSHVAWRESRCVSEVPSPLVYDGRVYMVKDGGLVTCLDADSGRLLYRTRLGPSGAYFASPVAGDGKLFAASHGGAVVVWAAGDTFQRLAVSEFNEPIFATPAIADGRVYIRTASGLYAF